VTLLSHTDLAGMCNEVYTDANPTLGDPGGVRMYFRPRANEFVVCFAGTPVSGQDEIAAWMRDFDAWPWWYYGLGVLHKGFGNGTTEAWAQIHRQLPSSPFYTFVGHSLGGALATGVAACYASRPSHQPFRLITFGCPRMVAWGNNRFMRLVEQATVARWYQRAGDPVPHVPFSRLFGWPWYKNWDYRITIGEPLPGSDIDLPLWPLDPKNDQNHNILQYQKDLRLMGV
jgi:hypothetical protein